MRKSVYHRFNSQPPEGGWTRQAVLAIEAVCFNSQPPEGGWEKRREALERLYEFQLTAARRRLVQSVTAISVHTLFQLTAARRRLVGTMSRNLPPALFQLTAARRRLAVKPHPHFDLMMFQLTAARRRLGHRQSGGQLFRCFNSQPPEGGWLQ